ncbi:hypothetical protein BC628DRAFT_1391850 [Trametes gibbosa]|nr:hypothetical protein BC628DRAFT_1391850 [Trametes gibbosa]
MSDRGYINLIRHLTRPSSTLSLETLQASIAHYLARPPAPVPGKSIPLVAAVLSSPLFRPHTYATLSALALAFRQAVHLRVGVLKEEAERHPESLFSRGVDVRGRLARWTGEVRAGFVGSTALVRLACASGLLLGLEDWETELRVKEKEGKARAKAEEEVVLALAEVVDEYAREGSGWEKDFRRVVGAKSEEDPLALAVLISSQCVQCIAAERLQALPLSVLTDILINTIDRSFHGGAFLANASVSASVDVNNKASVSPNSPFARNVRSIAESPYIATMASLARFAARALTVLVESRQTSGWESIGRALRRFQILTSTVERGWIQCPFATVTNDNENLANNETREIAIATWSVLKTLLFTTLMVSQSILSATVFVPNPHTAQISRPAPSPQEISLDILHVLSHLSFIMPQFGGVASTSEGGLPELKRAFYMALDVLASDRDAAERFVSELSQRDVTLGKGKDVETIPRPLVDARNAFALACVEQLVPVVSEETIQMRVYPICLQHLWDSGYRETYESAHSTMLAMFASHAKGKLTYQAERSASRPAFVERLIPMYALCLVENSSDGQLSTAQLCMAYAALVRSAGVSGLSFGVDGESIEGDSKAWLCIEVLLHTIQRIAAESSQPVPSEHLHRLHLALIACLSSVSLTLLPRLLGEVKTIIIASSSQDGRPGEMRNELVQALFRTILQEVGDAEKEYLVGWWSDHRENLTGTTDGGVENKEQQEGSLVARL